MKYAILELEKNPIAYAIYLIKETSDESIRLLAIFLRSDVGGIAYEIIEFLENPKDKYGSGNACDIRKIDGNVVITFQLFECDPGYYDPDFIPELRFQTTIPEFIKLLRQWDVAMKRKPDPKEIIITQDDEGRVELTIKD